MKRYDRLIFVSKSDTAVAPMAEAIMKSKYLLEELEICSKGMVVLFPEPINPKAEAVLNEYGLSMIDHVSTPLLEEDLNERTLVLAVDQNTEQKIRKEFNPGWERNLHVLHEFVHVTNAVPDPYGGTLEAYGYCFEELEKIIKKLVIQLNEEELLC